jgi:hypothetical protein
MMSTPLIAKSFRSGTLVGFYLRARGWCQAQRLRKLILGPFGRSWPAKMSLYYSKTLGFSMTSLIQSTWTQQVPTLLSQWVSNALTPHSPDVAILSWESIFRTSPASPQDQTWAWSSM